MNGPASATVQATILNIYSRRPNPDGSEWIAPGALSGNAARHRRGSRAGRRRSERRGVAMTGLRPQFPNHVRDLSPELARIAVFATRPSLGLRPIGTTHEKSVASCEGAACSIRDNANDEKDPASNEGAAP